MPRKRVMQLGTAGPLYGAERWILALCRSLDPEQVESHIAVINDLADATTSPLTAAAQELGLNAYDFAAPGKFSLTGVRTLRDLIRQHRIEIVHTHGYKADAMALLAVRGTQAKVLATPHGWSHDAGLKLRLYEWLDRQMFQLVDAVAPLSPDLAQSLEPSLGRSGKLTLIPNGVDLIEIDSATGIDPQIAELHQRGPVVGYVGQLIARKDIPTLLRAFAAWDRSDASLVLVGEGDQRAALEADATALGIAPRTLFAGWRPDRIHWIRGMDLFVLPSMVEGMPRCLMEAMAARVPVAASDIPGSRDLVRHGETGQLFPPGDVAALIACLKSLDDQSHLQAMVATARHEIEAEHSGASMARRYERLFAEIVG